MNHFSSFVHKILNCKQWLMTLPNDRAQSWKDFGFMIQIRRRTYVLIERRSTKRLDELDKLENSLIRSLGRKRDSSLLFSLFNLVCSESKLNSSSHRNRGCDWQNSLGQFAHLARGVGGREAVTSTSYCSHCMLSVILAQSHLWSFHQNRTEPTSNM